MYGTSASLRGVYFLFFYHTEFFFLSKRESFFWGGLTDGLVLAEESLCRAGWVGAGGEDGWPGTRARQVGRRDLSWEDINQYLRRKVPLSTCHVRDFCQELTGVGGAGDASVVFLSALPRRCINVKIS
jgi:hypothetical protein